MLSSGIEFQNFPLNDTRTQPNNGYNGAREVVSIKVPGTGHL